MIIETGLTAAMLYEGIKFWLPLLSIAWAVFKGFEWVKGSLVDTKKGIDELRKENQSGLGEVRTELKTQTAIIAEALNRQTEQTKEMRSDLRTFYAPANIGLAPQYLSTARASKPKPKTKPKVKKEEIKIIAQQELGTVDNPDEV